MNATPPDAGISPPDAERLLRQVDPGARLIPVRLLRRVAFRLSEDRPTPIHDDAPVRVPVEWLNAAGLSAVPRASDDPPELLLLPRPKDRWDEIPGAPALLRDYWSLLLFDAARVAAVLGLTDAAAAERLAAFGGRAERELSAVLRQDYRVADDAGPAARLGLLAGFAAVAATFFPAAWGAWLPSFPPPDETWRRAAAGADLAALAARCRPPLAADAAEPPPPPEPEAEEEPAEPPPDEEVPRLERTARKALRRGNAVRAAVLRWRIALGAAPAERAKAEKAARKALQDGLATRLGAVLGWNYAASRRWGRLLGALLPFTRSGHWSRAARCLYDLQTLAADLSGDLVITQPAEWARSFGREPLRRRIDHARPVLALRRLRSAAYHLDRVAAPSAVREPLHKLIVEEEHKAEAQIRAAIGPVVADLLREAGLAPANRLEAVAEGKIVAELVDRLCERGQLRFADLRDAIARSDLKLDDLRGAGEFFRGDALLRADALLGARLAGVYRRGEVYLRWIQRANAAAFGTAWGRWLTLFVAGPFGGAFMLVVFAKYLAHEFEKVSAWIARRFPDPSFVGPPSPPAEAAHGVELGPESTAAVVGIGVFLLALIHAPPVRAAVVAGLSAVGRALRWAVWDGPARLWKSPWAKRVRRHPAALFVGDRLGTAFVIGLFVFAAVVVLRVAAYGTAALWALGSVALTAAVTAAWVFAAAAVIFNLPQGRVLNDWLAERFSAAAQYVRVNLLPGLIAGVWGAFRRLAEAVERGLYAVDEWLRFRSQRAGGGAALGAVLAALWFPVAYLTRFAFYLLLEPQINPIKHFPVVTVSHKLLLPLIPSLSSATGLSEGTSFLIIAGIPGVFGFMAWELQENWRLYRANRPAKPRAVRLGHHGETARGLLRPGFHSGTVPKLYGRMRAARRDALATKEGRYRHELEELAAAVRLGVERELLRLLDHVPAWRAQPPATVEVAFGVESIVVTVAREGAEPYRLSVVHANGRLLANEEQRGWAVELPAGAAEAFAAAVERLVLLLASDWEARPTAGAGSVAPGWAEQVAFWDAATGYGAKDALASAGQSP